MSVERRKMGKFLGLSWSVITWLTSWIKEVRKIANKTIDQRKLECNSDQAVEVTCLDESVSRHGNYDHYDKEGVRGECILNEKIKRLGIYPR
ncbi:hypothetical protein C1H46_036791 [Malus baccata]|uniref:Uncharacterized protein n=1 Tax=Malus baccata TaxID=106549 RepID=A0A540KTZ4_MALBA|nr:hypothetical protein C1H46_036791 [Malus baccata]